MSVAYLFYQRACRPAGRVLLLAAMAALACKTSHAQRPSVQVEFHITDCLYQGELGAKLAEAEQAFLPIFVDALQQKIGFLKFTATPQPYRLVVLLGDEVEPATHCDGRRDMSSAAGEVRYHLKLIPPATASQPEIPPVSWVFRSADDSLRRLSRKVDANEKIRDVELAGASSEEGASPGELRRQFIHGNFPDLIPNVLSQIPVAEGGEFIIPPGWEVPLKPSETCLGEASLLRIENQIEFTDIDPEIMRIEVEVVRVPGPERPRVRARASNDPPQTQKVQQLTEHNVKLVKVIRVYVTKYVRSCNTPVTPADSGLAGGTP